MKKVKFIEFFLRISFDLLWWNGRLFSQILRNLLVIINKLFKLERSLMNYLFAWSFGYLEETKEPSESVFHVFRFKLSLGKFIIEFELVKNVVEVLVWLLTWFHLDIILNLLHYCLWSWRVGGKGGESRESSGANLKLGMVTNSEPELVKYIRASRMFDYSSSSFSLYTIRWVIKKEIALAHSVYS